MTNVVKIIEVHKIVEAEEVDLFAFKQSSDEVRNKLLSLHNAATLSNEKKTTHA